MGLSFIKQLDKDHILGCWNISETITLLKNGIQPEDLVYSQLQKNWSERRMKEWFAVRNLLGAILPDPPRILYDSDSKPYLEHSRYNISISHSALLAVLVIAKKKSVGIDIQAIRNSVLPGRDFFCNAAEQSWLGADDLLAHNLIWSAKETIYKCYGKANLSAKDQIEICPFELAQFGQLSAYIYDSEDRHSMTLHYEMMGSHVLTYTQ